MSKDVLQRVFHKAVGGVVAQGCLGMDAPGGVCRYRTSGGPKCGIGHLIPDEEYEPAFEELGVRSIVGRVPALADLGDWVGLDFLERLQSCHDDSDSLERFVLEARELAEQYQLDPAVASL